MGMMRGLAAILGVAALMAVVAACGNGAEPTSLSDEAPTPARPTVGGATPTEANPPTTPIVSHGGPVNDYVSLVDNLRAAGAAIGPAGNVSQPFFSPQGQMVTVNGEDVQAFEFASGEEADTVAETVSADGSSIGTSMVGWVAPPHFYKAGKLIVIYVGTDDDVIDALQEAMGPQFAGGESLTPDRGSAPDDRSQKIAQSQAQRDTSPDVSQSSLSELTAGNTAFAFDLYQAIRESSGNLFFSPFSISTALAMPYAGARNETERQMAATLHFTQPQEILHPAFNALDRELSDSEVAPGEQDFELRLANSLWGQIDFEIEAEFLDLIAGSYGAGLRLVDFIEPVSREQARLAINQWASDQTEGKIEDLIPERVLTDLTRLVLANAIYFNAKWDRPFLNGTKDDEFDLLGGDQVTVPMMSRRASTKYAQGQGYQAVELAYKGGSAQMIVLLPDQGRFEDIESSLGKELMEEILQEFASTDVKLFMPRFEYEASLVLADTLAEMGMRDAFAAQRADFTGIVVNPNPRLYISDVLHKAFVAVDEIGTEAAASTAVVMEIESMPTVVKIDRPFIFIIRDSRHATILFMGRVLDPTA